MGDEKMTVGRVTFGPVGKKMPPGKIDLVLVPEELKRLQAENARLRALLKEIETIPLKKWAEARAGLKEAKAIAAKVKRIK